MAPDASSAGRASRTPIVLLKTGLLVLWALVSFVCCFFARDLQFMVAGWPFNYWMAAQGALLAFIGIVAAYAWDMNRLERAEAAAGNADDTGV